MFNQPLTQTGSSHRFNLANRLQHQDLLLISLWRRPAVLFTCRTHTQLTARRCTHSSMKASLIGLMSLKSDLISHLRRSCSQGKARAAFQRGPELETDQHTELRRAQGHYCRLWWGQEVIIHQMMDSLRSDWVKRCVGLHNPSWLVHFPWTKCNVSAKAHLSQNFMFL